MELVSKLLARPGPLYGLSTLRHCSGNMPEEANLNSRAVVVIRGTVRVHDNLLRVTARATTADSRLLWSHQVDSLVGGTALIQLQERVANEVLTNIEKWLEMVVRPESEKTHRTVKCVFPSCLTDGVHPITRRLSAANTTQAVFPRLPSYNETT